MLHTIIWICQESLVSVILIFHNHRTTGYGFWKEKKNRSMKTSISVISKTLKNPNKLKKNPIKKIKILRQVIWFFQNFENHGYIPKLVIWFWRTIIMNLKNHPNKCHKFVLSFSISNNHSTLVLTHQIEYHPTMVQHF